MKSALPNRPARSFRERVRDTFVRALRSQAAFAHALALLVALAGVACAPDEKAPRLEEKRAALNASPQINHFALIAANSVRLQTSTIVNGGDVGAKGTAGPFIASGVALDVGASARVETTRNLIAQSVRLGASAIVGDVQTSQLTGTGTRGTLTPLVALPALPATSAVTVGTANLSVAASATASPAPGRFATISVGTSGKLRLAAGVYEVRDLTLATSARIEALGAVQIRVANRLTVGASAFIGAASGVTLTANQLRIEVSGINGTTGALTATPSAASLGSSAQVRALFLVPNGTLALASSVVATGAMVARDIDFAASARITFEDGFTNPIVAPAITTQPASQTVVVGSTATFSAVVTGTSPALQWQRNGVAIAGATGSSYTTPTLSMADSGASYRVVATNSAGSATSNNATLTVVACITGSYTPQPTSCGVGACARTGQRTCVNNALVDSCVPGAPGSEVCNDLDDDCDGTVDGLAPRCNGSNVERCTSGAWVPEVCNDGNFCNGAEQCASAACAPGTPPSLDDLNVCTADSCTPAEGILHTPVAAGTPCGTFSACSSSGQCVQLPAPTITTQPQAQTVLVGGAATFVAQVSGAQLSLQWLRNSSPIPGATSNAYTTDALAKADSGTFYALRAQNPAGEVLSQVVSVTVVDCLVGSYQPTPTTCGVGSCARTGERRCVNGEIVDTCAPGAPSSEVCDGLDNDCNGSPDGLPPRCTGSTAERCSAGAWVPEVCNDANACNGVEQCISGACVAGIPPAQDDNNVCTADSCSASAGVTHTPVASGTSCGTFSACNDAGQCVQLPAPTITTQPAAQTVLVGSSATFTAQVSGGQLSLQWQRDGVAIPGATDSSYTTAELSKADSGASYRLIAQNPAGQVLSNPVTVTVVDCIVATFQVTPTSCGVGRCADTGERRCVNGEIVDTCSPGSPGSESCNGIDDDCDGSVDGLAPRCSGSNVERCVAGGWSPEPCNDENACNGVEQCGQGACVAGTPPSLDDGNPCTADGCAPGTGATHTPVASGTACGPASSCDGEGACVQIPAPQIQTQPTDVSAVVGGQATFSVAASGPNLSYQWLRNGAPISAANAASYTRTGLALVDNDTQFSVRVQNPGGEVTSNAATLRVTTAASAASLTIAGDNPRTVAADYVLLTGSALDISRPARAVEVSSDRYPAVSFGGLVEESGTFSAEVPLALGTNLLTVRTVGTAQPAQATITVESVNANLPRVTIVSPSAGTRTDQSTVSVTGSVRSLLPPDDIRLVLGNKVTFPTGNPSSGQYTFQFNGVALVPGDNILTVRAETGYGNVLAQTLITRSDSGAPAAAIPPRISVQATGADVYLPGPAVPVAGDVVAQRCVSTVTVNGSAARLTGAGSSMSFEASLAFAPGLNDLPITVIARDCDNVQATLTYTAHRDVVAPVINLANLQLAPAINTATETPYSVSGTITEPNLAGLSANEQSIGALPNGSASYSFRFDVPLVHGTNQTVRIDAWDFSGNHTLATVNLTLANSLQIAVVSPADGAGFLANGGSGQLDVVARVPGIGAGDQVVARLDSDAALPLSVSGDVATLTMTASVGEHTLTISALSASGGVLAQRSLRFKVTDKNAIALAIASSAPSNGQTGVEGNSAVELVLSKPVTDPLALSVRVTETVHGMTYAADNAGASVRPDVVRVDRDQEQVPGTTTIARDNDGLRFEAAREFAYGATVDVEAFYDGTSLGKTRFQVRPLPTLAIGTVAAASGEPVSGVTVELVELGRRTTTDDGGAFSFGFNESASTGLPAGRYTLRSNADGRVLGHGSAEARVTLQVGRLNKLPVARLPNLGAQVAARIVEGGDANVLFDGGKLRVNLTQASVRMPDGSPRGSLHIEPYFLKDLSIPRVPYADPVWVYAASPSGVQVSGDVALEIALPTLDGSHDYLNNVQQRMVLLGVDAQTLELVPVGVGLIDVQARKLRSEGVTHFQRLDAIGYAPLGADMQAVLARYGRGEIQLEQLVREISTVMP